ncbi:cation:proton antiporter [Rubrobacter naiadicus]|uniref:cation:proton antiporter n=1 Tax=Rubrobacter naiadicus TaxID=1392641 RepID=UPI00236204CC|nr:cation:proton antiporter [Rubrobacter naiadicus]
MGDLQRVLLDFGLILGAGLVSQLVARIVRLPEMIVMIAAGVLIGPAVLGVASNPLGGVGAQLLFNAGVAMILFHGGVGVSLKVISRVAFGLGMLVLPGVLITAFIVALAVAGVFGVGFAVALMVGAILSATDPAILIPLFDRLNIRPKISQTLISESAFNDPISTVLALALVGTVQSGSFTLSDTFFGFVEEMVIGTAIGLFAGFLLAYLVSTTTRWGIWDEAPGVAILAVVALAYFSNEAVGGSGYLAAFVMGLVVGNMGDLRLGRRLGLGQDEVHARRLESFVAQIAEIATLLIFVTLGINLPFDALSKYFLGGLVVMAVFIFVARPVTVLVSLLPDRRARWSRDELLFLCWSRETGVVPTAVASLLLAQGVKGADIAVSMVALAVFATLLLQATTAAPLARRLGLIEGTPADAG